MAAPDFKANNGFENNERENKMKKNLYEVEVMNCKLTANSAMKRHQKFMVHASSREEAQAKVRAENPEIFNGDTWFGKTEIFV